MVSLLPPKNKVGDRYRWLVSATILIALLSFTGLQQKERLVICFGDSITHGARVDGQSWVWYLQQENTRPFKFINAGRSGRRTSDRKELLPVLEKYPQADLYVFFLGVNDLKNGNDSMVHATLQNMEWMINQVHTKLPKAKILLLAPSDINTREMSQVNKDKLYNNQTRESLAKLENGYRSLARKEQVDFLSLLHVVSKDAYADGLHPDAKGQQQIKKAIWKKIRNYAK